MDIQPAPREAPPAEKPATMQLSTPASLPASARGPLPAPAASAAPGPGAPAMPHVEGVEHKYVDVNGVRYHYAEAGSGDPLVLIHGFPENWYMWRDLIPELARHYRVIAPDVRGAGWSDAPRDDRYGKEQIADELAGFMDAVGAPRAKVMAHDWGGYLGFMLALRHPDKVDKYLAMDIATPWPSAKALPDAWRILYQPVLAAPGMGAALLRRPSFIKAMLNGASHIDRWSEADREVFSSTYRDKAHSEAGSEMYRTFLQRELVPWARGDYKRQRLEPETLLLVGEKDPVIRHSVIDGYERYSRDMRAEFIPGAGHFLPEERPDVVLEKALEFFGAPGSGSPTAATPPAGGSTTR